MGSDYGAADGDPLLQKGVCYVLFAYDGARSIDLDAAERRIHDATQAPDDPTQTARSQLS